MAAKDGPPRKLCGVQCISIAYLGVLVGVSVLHGLK